MKLISLNIWGGRAYEPLMEYVKGTAGDSDIFCFQEVFFSPGTEIVESRNVRINILADLEAALPDFRPLVAPVGNGYDTTGPVDFDIIESQAMFIKNNADWDIESDGSIFTSGKYRRLGAHEAITDVPNNFQYARLSFHSKKLTIVNEHGTAYPGNKLDTPERLTQSQKIAEFLRGEDSAKILCGDFNLLPETKSIAMIEEIGMINLINKFKIELTRSKLSPFFGKPGFQKFADYAFVSPDVNVLNFTVPDVAVSDHLPLVLEFS